MDIDKKKLTDLIEENYIYASVLHHFGIDFYNYSEQTLQQVCLEKNLNPAIVIENLESVNQKGEEHDLSLISFPLDLIIEYLKHKHYIFIKQTLPYLVKLIECYPSNSKFDIVEDIKVVFPLFVEDFVEHIHEEEDTFFKYVLLLDKATKKTVNYGRLYYAMEKNSVKEFAKGHEVHDDVMAGIRSITNNYQIKSDSPVLLKVIYSELQAFEKNLIIHAKIENEVLIPKARLIEQEIKEQHLKYSLLN